jgi:hypothetical protein
MTIGEAPDCIKCHYYNQEEGKAFTCKAFPKRIPESILGGIKHTEVIKGQQGDYVYKPFNLEEWKTEFNRA